MISTVAEDFFFKADSVSKERERSFSREVCRTGQTYTTHSPFLSGLYIYKSKYRGTGVLGLRAASDTTHYAHRTLLHWTLTSVSTTGNHVPRTRRKKNTNSHIPDEFIPSLTSKMIFENLEKSVIKIPPSLSPSLSLVCCVIA